MTQRKPGGDRVAEALADPRRAVWRLALPILAGIGVQTLYNLTDMAFVGRLGGSAVAALTFSMPLVFLASGIAFGLGHGATSAVARHLGAGDRPGAGHAAEHAILLALAVGLATAAAAIAFQLDLFRALGARDEPLRLATRYFGILAPGFVLVLLNGTFHAILAGEGDTRTPVALQGSGTLLNIGLDPVFIFAAGMGIRGAAVATVVSQSLVFLAFLVHLFVRRGSYVEFRFRAFRPSAATAAGLLRVGLPSSASMVLMAAGGMFYNRIVSAFGPDAVAGLGVGSRLDAVFFLPVIALATSMVTVVGMFFGAGRVDLIRSTVRYALTRSVAFAVAIGVLFWIFAPRLAGLFTTEPVIVDVAVGYIRVTTWAFPFIAVGIVSGSVFRGLGSGLPGLVLTSLRVLLISVPLAWTLTRVFRLGIETVWLSFAASGLITSFVALWWMHRRLRAEERRERRRRG